jgi:pantoate--beta-alanine ligase
VTTIARTRAELDAARHPMSGRVAVVMTMGALHEGHASLVRRARELADSVIVTIFLNPLQFAAGEDLDRYPKTFDADLEICRREGVDLVFAPSLDVVYPVGDPLVRVSAGWLGGVLEGASRPGHFDGVLTVVAKLLNLSRVDVALFGEKDAQQLALIRAMVNDLDLHVEVVAVPTVRETGGLALSSRNTYLSDVDRSVARILFQALRAGAACRDEGPDEIVAAVERTLAGEPAAGVDYVALVDEATWRPVDRTTVEARLLVAAQVGPTRLIDNVRIVLGTPVAARGPGPGDVTVGA